MSAFEIAKRIKTIADIGLLYATSEYDVERYTELQNISFNLLSEQLNKSSLDVMSFYEPCIDYPTVKVDVRGLLLNEKDELLLVKEKSDEKWSIPGGWAEPGFSPKEAIIKELKEETGLDVKATKLLALWDIRYHQHPPTPYSIYKIIIYCEPLHFQLNKGFDILDVGFFSITSLPPLSENRILKSQIEALYKSVKENKTQIMLD